MQNNTSTNKRIAKNTGLLYVRQLLTLGLSLYLSRLTLQVLGENDFGIYATVAGFTAMLSTVTASLSSGTQRFITYELGRGDLDKLNRVYSTSINIHLILSALLIIFGEIFGSWFIFNKMTLPPERVFTAFIVFQFTILNSVFGLINAPNNAEIIAHEDMGVWSFVAILEVGLRLASVIIIGYISWDRLIIYAFCQFAVQFLIRTLSVIWCHRKYIEAKYRYIWDKDLIRSMISVTGWIGLNNLAVVGFIQGTNILLNVFFGPILNAAYAVALQAYTGLRQFCSSFQLASNPQIVKLSSTEDWEQMHRLLFTVCKISFFLIFILAFPVMMIAHVILEMWLNEIPSHTESFFVLLLCYAFIDVLAYPLDIAAQATGRLKKYSICVSILVLSTLLFSYIAYMAGAVPETIYVIAIVVSWICLAVRLYLLQELIHMNMISFVKNVIARILIVGFSASFFPLLLAYYMPTEFYLSLLLYLVSLLSATLAIYFIGLSYSEKAMIKSMYHKIRQKVSNK